MEKANKDYKGIKPIKKEILAVLLVSGIAGITACGGAAEELSTTESPADNVSETEMPQPYAEYVAVLEQILRERTDFVGTDYSDWQDGVEFQKNCFAFADVDGDGRTELLFNFNQSGMVDMCEVVYDYDEETDTLRKELVEWVDTEYFSNGIVKVTDSHNHGRDPEERGTYPYFLYRYDRETDSYQLVYSIDGWDGRAIPENFPRELDTDGDELLYYIYREAGETPSYEDEMILNQEEYDSWVEEMTPEWCRINVTYHSMTEGEIENISSGFAQAAAYASQSDNWLVRAEYGENFYYLLYDMDKDGSLELITSFMQGSGRYSDNHFFSLTDTGELVELPLVSLCGSVEKECLTVFDLGGWLEIKAYQDENGIIRYEGHDYIREGTYGGYDESGFYYLENGTVYQDSIRGYSEIVENDAGNYEVHYYSMTTNEEIAEEQYEEIYENYMKDMTEVTVYQCWKYYTEEEGNEGDIQEEILRLKLLESFLGSI